MGEAIALGDVFSPEYVDPRVLTWDKPLKPFQRLALAIVIQAGRDYRSKRYRRETEEWIRDRGDDYLSIHVVAGLLETHEYLVQRWVETGKIPRLIRNRERRHLTQTGPQWRPKRTMAGRGVVIGLASRRVQTPDARLRE